MLVRFRSSNTQNSRRKHPVEMRSEPSVQMGVAQYHTVGSQHEDRRLMARIALGLSLAYGVFVTCWIWVTRLRSRRSRH